MSPSVHSVIYVEVRPTSRADAVALLERYRAATRREDGNLRCEVEKAFEAHGTSANATQFRQGIHAIRNAPADERVHTPVSVGSGQPVTNGDVVYVVTHVDVIPPRKDEGLAAVWKDARAAEAHSMAEATRRVRDTLEPMSGALSDERMFTALE